MQFMVDFSVTERAAIQSNFIPTVTGEGHIPCTLTMPPFSPLPVTAPWGEAVQEGMGGSQASGCSSFTASLPGSSNELFLVRYGLGCIWDNLDAPAEVDNHEPWPGLHPRRAGATQLSLPFTAQSKPTQWASPDSSLLPPQVGIMYSQSLFSMYRPNFQAALRLVVVQGRKQKVPSCVFLWQRVMATTLPMTAFLGSGTGEVGPDTVKPFHNPQL